MSTTKHKTDHSTLSRKKTKKVKVVWFSWKDRYHPQEGGAERVSAKLMQHLVQDGHSVTLITSTYPGAASRETRDGIDIIRAGGRYTVYFAARRLYKKFVRDEDLVIDEMNTIPFLAGLYVETKNKLLLSYQLARQVWFFQMVPPLSWIGYLLEIPMLKIVGRVYSTAATESKSSQKDMQRHGLKGVKVFRVGMDLEPLKSLPKKVGPETVLSLGSVRPMKRTLDAVKAFEAAHELDPKLKMVIAGDMGSAYARNLEKYVQNSLHRDAISLLGRIDEEQKQELMRSAGVIVVTSIKEGWGLIVTEANSQGTPAVAYDVDGLRDSVRSGETGLVTPNGNTKAMGEAIVQLLRDDNTYQKIRTQAWTWSQEFTYANSYSDFRKILTLVVNEAQKKS